MDPWVNLARVTCPHCGGGDVSCCQCGGSRIVSARVAEQNCRWAWAWGACACAACQRVGRLRAALPQEDSRAVA